MTRTQEARAPEEDRDASGRTSSPQLSWPQRSPPRRPPRRRPGLTRRRSPSSPRPPRGCRRSRTRGSSSGNGPRHPRRCGPHAVELQAAGLGTLQAAELGTALHLRHARAALGLCHRPRSSNGGHAPARCDDTLLDASRDTYGLPLIAAAAIRTNHHSRRLALMASTVVAGSWKTRPKAPPTFASEVAAASRTWFQTTVRNDPARYSHRRTTLPLKRRASAADGAFPPAPAHRSAARSRSAADRTASSSRTAARRAGSTGAATGPRPPAPSPERPLRQPRDRPPALAAALDDARRLPRHGVEPIYAGRPTTARGRWIGYSAAG